MAFPPDSDHCEQSEPELSKAFIDLIDKAVANDFLVKEITDEDRKNIYYQAMKTTLNEAFQTKILYERKVFTGLAVLPKVQFLFGIKPRDALCLILHKPIHKVVTCGGFLAKLNNNCFLVNGLQFLLEQSDADKAWCYVPKCPCDKTCELTPQALELRTILWSDKTTL
jgi:hypothetical protein